VVVRDKRGYVPLRKTSKNRIWDCGLLGSTHRIVFGGEKLWKQLRSSRGTRHDDELMMMMIVGVEVTSREPVLSCEAARDYVVPPVHFLCCTWLEKLKGYRSY